MYYFSYGNPLRHRMSLYLASFRRCHRSYHTGRPRPLFRLLLWHFVVFSLHTRPVTLLSFRSLTYLRPSQPRSYCLLPTHIIFLSNSESARSAPPTASLAHTSHSALLHILTSPSLSLTFLSLRLFPTSEYSFIFNTSYHTTYFLWLYNRLLWLLFLLYRCISTPITNNIDDVNTVSA